MCDAPVRRTRWLKRPGPEIPMNPKKTEADPLVVYLSASLSNGPLNLRIRDALGTGGIELVLPQEFAPARLNHPEYPLSIYQRCIAEMDRCHAGLILLDAFGIDSASEAGWFAARGKPFVGLAAANLRFLRHWMVKGNLTAVVCLDDTVRAGVAADPILGRLPVRLCESVNDLAPVRADLILSFAGRKP